MVVQNKTQELPISAEPRDLKVQTKKDNPQVVELTWQPPKILNGRITGIFCMVCNYLIVIVTLFFRVYYLVHRRPNKIRP